MKIRTEELRQVVSLLQWSVSGVVVIAVILLLTAVPVPEWFGWVGGWYVATVGPFALIVGMVLCWKLPDWRKWIVIPVEVFVLFCGVGLIHVQVDKAKTDETKAAYEAFLASPEYTTALDAYNAAKAKQEAWLGRIGKIPGDFTTGARDVKGSSETAKTDFETAKQEFLTVAAKAPQRPGVVTAAGSFRIFGKDNSDWLEALILFILAAGNECVALALSWKPKASREVVVSKPAETEEKSKPHIEPEEGHKLSIGEVQEPQKTWEDYYAAAIHGRTDGKVWGREKVCEYLGISERQGRKLYAECVERGKIIPSPASAPRVGNIEL